jgi:hypothetical protein
MPVQNKTDSLPDISGRLSVDITGIDFQSSEGAYYSEYSGNFQQIPL